MSRKPLTTYRSLCTEFYDNEQHPRHDAALDFYKKSARDAIGPVLEPMCGTGRFLIPLLQEGIDIEGFDASPYMLQVLNKKNSQAHVWQDFVQDFMTVKRYGLIFVPYGSWGLIADLADSHKGLQRMYDHLVPGGKLIIEIETVASVPATLGMWHRALQSRSDGSYLALNTYPTYNQQNQLFKSICRYESISKKSIVACETEDFYMYLYKFDEFEAFLRKAGFVNIAKYRDHNGTSATDSSEPLLIYEATK